MIRLLLPLVLLVKVSSGFANTGVSGQPTLMDQFQSVRDQAEVIESYRMLKAFQVENLWKSVMDTLRQKDKIISEVNASIPAFEQEISSLRNTIEKKDASVAEMEFAGAHITVWGVDFTKSGFVKLASLTTLIVLTVAALAFWAFKVSFKATRESRKLYDEVSKEFEDYKHRVVEKEVKLLRELQDYRNKMMELKSA